MESREKPAPDNGRGRSNVSPPFLPFSSLLCWSPEPSVGPMVSNGPVFSTLPREAGGLPSCSVPFTRPFPAWTHNLGFSNSVPHNLGVSQAWLSYFLSKSRYVGISTKQEETGKYFSFVNLSSGGPSLLPLFTLQSQLRYPPPSATTLNHSLLSVAFVPSTSSR